MEQILKYLGNKEQLWVAILAVFAVGFGKILEKFLKKDTEELNETLEIRKALRDEVNALHAQENVLENKIHLLQSDSDSWREKYWKQVELNTHLQADILQLKITLADVKLELHEYKEMNLSLSKQISHSGEHETPKLIVPEET